MSVQDCPLDSNFNSSESLNSPSSGNFFHSHQQDLESNVGDFNIFNDLYCKHNPHKETFNDMSEKYHNFKKDVRDFIFDLIYLLD
jgi:hypothetical protein